MGSRIIGLARQIPHFTLAVFGQLAVIVSSAGAHEAAQSKHVEEVRVWGEQRDSRQAGYTNPTSLLTQEDMVSINVATTEDLVKYEPGIVIRKRYIGDSNGTLGLRGSNMFATSRSMVFADGVPLHYLLQSRWSGAPRWTMVSASEIAQVEILYGPFSAEYSGNAMGGVVLIETAIPQEREVHVDLDYFSQDFAAYGFDDTLNGHKAFMSYGDKFGDLNFYISYNRLENDSQPQSFYFDNRDPSSGAVPVNSAVVDRDVFGDTAFYFGDTGVEQATTDNFKLKLGYDIGDWSTLVNIAFEDRNTLRDSANSYLVDADGVTRWSGNFVQDGTGINVSANRLGVSNLDRQSLSVGFRVKGDIKDNLRFEGNASDFRILKDNSRASSHNPNDPLFTGRGQTTDYDDTGWQTLEGKLIVNNIGVDGLELVTGARYEAYQLNLDVYNSLDWTRGDNSGYSSRSGGETEISAAFVQANWAINEIWDMAIGGRYEHWKSFDGYFSEDIADTAAFELAEVPESSSSTFSPKFSLGYKPAQDWLVRYSVAQAYRFPIVEELFTQSASYSTIIEAKPDLKPEDGLHQNLMIERQFDTGYVRVNVFTETIQDAIESQSNLLPGGGSVTTFSAIDEVETDGVEFIFNRYGVLMPEVDVRFNVAYTKSIIEDNSTAEGENPESTIEGNDYPRMPRWRSNLMLTYHASDRWDLSGTVQYADKSFGRLDNTDDAEEVMGAQDGYTRIGLKTTYDVSDQVELGFGIDNLTDESSFVAHPWPGRTLYFNFSYHL